MWDKIFLGRRKERGDTTSWVSAPAACGCEDSTCPSAAGRHSRESVQLTGHGAQANQPEGCPAFWACKHVPEEHWTMTCVGMNLWGAWMEISAPHTWWIWTHCSIIKARSWRWAVLFWCSHSAQRNGCMSSLHPVNYLPHVWPIHCHFSSWQLLDKNVPKLSLRTVGLHCSKQGAEFTI